VLPDIQEFPQIAADDAGGFVAVWEDRRSLFKYDLYGVRILSDGSIAPGWQTNGSPVMVGSESHENFSLTEDGNGGLFAAAEGSPGGQNWIQHIEGNGQPEVGWSIEGVRLTPTISGQEFPIVLSDGVLGAYVAWDDARYNGHEVFLKHYGPEPTAVSASLVSADAEPGLARLTWSVAGATTFALERRTGASAFASVASGHPDGSGHLVLEDRVAEPGAYVYRLEWTEDGASHTSSEVTVIVPSQYVLSLAGFTPNPASARDLRAAFTLPRRAPGQLAMYDVMGRAVATQDVGGLDAGKHDVRMPSASPGMYWLRLTHDGRTMTRRGVVIR